MKNQRSFLFAAIVLGVLTGCGGGGGGGSAPAPAPAPPPPASTGPSPTCIGAEPFATYADATIVAGKAAGAVIAGCSGALSEVQWTQVNNGAPSVTLLAAKSQAISFEPASAGTYAFTVTFRDATGAQRSAVVATVVIGTPSATPFLARVDQAVRKGGNATLRAWPAANAGETITWTQTAGPLATIDATNTDQNHLRFTAPDVARDTTLVFRATKKNAAGATLDTDEAIVLVESYGQAPADPQNTGPYVFSDSHVSRVYPYRAAGPFAAALVRCTYEANLQYFGAGTNLCPMSTLPFLQQTTAGAVPTVSQIMDRVVVSHDWMGQAFEDFLTTQATDDMKRLFNGVTAVVIGAHVRPSFYYALTGAIYLDADNFWLTAEQRDVIDETPDFRSEFDKDLLYSTAWRYTSTQNGSTASIFVDFPPTSRIARTQSYLLAEAGWLLYHELGHASDFLPPAERPRLNNNPALSAWGFIGPMFNARTLPSDQLSASLPLQSQEMFALAQVKYVGATATPAQRGYTPDQVAAFFASDRATDDYDYTTTREDIAMTFEEFMMFRNHGWRRDFAVTDKITSTTTRDTLTVRWGQRGRVGDAAVKPRAQMAVQQLAPWVDANTVQNLPAPIQMRPGDSWASNLALPAPLGGLAGLQAFRSTPDFASEHMLLMHDVSRRHGATPNDRLLHRAGH